MKQAYPGTQAVVRALRLLKACAGGGARTLAALSASAGLNKATAYRLLSALESEGMAARAADGSWRAGPALLALGGQALGAAEIRVAARPTIEALARATGETATVEVLVGGESLILDEAQGGHVIGSRTEAGTRWPAHATSTGKALLAALPEVEREALIARTLARPTARTRTGDALRRDLAKARAQGHAVADGELEPGFVAIGAPVHGADGRAVAALSVGAPAARMAGRAVERVARDVMKAAAEVSVRLGFDGGGETAAPRARQRGGRR